MRDEPGELELELLERAEVPTYRRDTRELFRRAAEAIGAARRLMQREIDDNTGMSGYRLLAFQEWIDRLEGGS
jgi:hypothetical protein